MSPVRVIAPATPPNRLYQPAYRHYVNQCQSCGATFHATHPRKAFCSHVCRARASEARRKALDTAIVDRRRAVVSNGPTGIDDVIADHNRKRHGGPVDLFA